MDSWLCKLITFSHRELLQRNDDCLHNSESWYEFLIHKYLGCEDCKCGPRKGSESIYCLYSARNDMKQWVALFGGTEKYQYKRDISLLGERSNELLGWRELPAKPQAMGWTLLSMRGGQTFWLDQLYPILRAEVRLTMIVRVTEAFSPKKANTISFWLHPEVSNAYE